MTEMTDEEVPAETLLDKEKEEEEFEAKFQEMKKERSARAKKQFERAFLTEMLKGAGIAIEARVEKYTEFLLCPITFQLLRDPVFCIGDGHTYEKEVIEEWFKTNNKSPKTGVELTKEQKVCVPNFAVRKACDAIRKEKQPENRSSDIPTLVSSDEIINQLNDKIKELKGTIENVWDEVASFWKKFNDFSQERGLATAQTIYEHFKLFEESVKDDDEISWIISGYFWTNQFWIISNGGTPPTPPPPDISRIRLEDSGGR
mmetsp:Transcript_1830/g.7103  ORF Transcript_1830/g.7103 Transcript_1830/m.7103 type:complete len:259 (+) Transcript_1830:210-986(+)